MLALLTLVIPAQLGQIARFPAWPRPIRTRVVACGVQVQVLAPTRPTDQQQCLPGTWTLLRARFGSVHLDPLIGPPTPPTARVVALFCVLRGVRCLAGSEPAANERYMTLDGLVAQDSGVPSVGPILRLRCANTSLLSPSRSQQVFVCLIRPSACCRKSGEMSFFFRPVRSGI